MGNSTPLTSTISHFREDTRYQQLLVAIVSARAAYAEKSSGHFMPGHAAEEIGREPSGTHSRHLAISAAAMTAALTAFAM